MLNQSKQTPEDASEESSLGEKHVEVLIDKPASPLDVLKSAINRNEDENVDDGDGEEEECGNGSPDHSADGFKGMKPILERDGTQRDGGRQPENDGRMPQGKKETDGNRPFALLH